MCSDTWHCLEQNFLDAVSVSEERSMYAAGAAHVPLWHCICARRCITSATLVFILGKHKMSEGLCGKKYLCKEDVDKEFVFSITPEGGDSVLISTAGAAFRVLCTHLQKQTPELYDDLYDEVVANESKWVDVPGETGKAVYDDVMSQMNFIN